MKITELENELNSNIVKNIYLVKGNDQFIQDHARKLFLNLIPDDQQVMNVSSFDFLQSGMESILDEAQSAPFFGDRRLLFITAPSFLSTEKNKSKFAPSGFSDYVKSPEPSTILVLLANYEKLDGRKKVVKNLEKNAVVVDASHPNESDVKNIISRMVKEKKYKIDSEAMDQLIGRTDNDLSLVAQGLEKLYLYNLQEKVITFDSVQKLIPQSLNQNVFDLINFLLKRKVKESMSVYSELLFQQEQPLRINAAILSQFRLLIQVKVLLDKSYSQGKIAGELGAHPYRVKLAIQTARQFQIEQLQKAFLGITDIEKQLKTTQRDPQELFELFLVAYNNGW
ncbi:DNA polymerase III subunit delta [Pediococcus claussenii]|uniref:DNA polymerase III subunit delta n=1 Tax=Pediococcus claussenii (strain ATCC BAA-344 / DSM 14800 / JCM 18046 / KCTC 3811 / LMG 21948 / P06) TaxID=701521 RepID=G8PCY4_PEDCP|nr:DNA polymerase III subunit delta [Pediococcus claussenii]AEV95119.1 DNA polymerase III, delta subunit [Pediococcus claussenii ATCC BAA-344]ANZ70305.1 DNA polymerase III subunit delta [Pediococcus claussenii]ANZ72121.1 DNA polymerase III subunit delta [Pediococcus claussenii]KRN18878.1 holA protein [Pediococcus claussenii]